MIEINDPQRSCWLACKRRQCQPQTLYQRTKGRRAAPQAPLPVIDLSRCGDHEKKPLFVVFCVIFAVSPSSAELAWCSCFINFWSFDISVSLFPPSLLRLAGGTGGTGGTGGVWLDIFKILSVRESWVDNARSTGRVAPLRMFVSRGK
jgi:hypothetical protein